MKREYRVGDTIQYRCFGGMIRTVKVTAKEKDIKNGRPGFDGIMAGGVTVWGYDYQIIPNTLIEDEEGGAR